MKKKYLLIILSALLIVAVFYIFRSNHTITNYPPKNTTIVALGDSLIQGVGAKESGGFVSMLEKKLERPIINLGVSGNTSEEGLFRIEEATNHNPGTVILLIGGNDFLRKVPKEETFKNLRQIIDTLQSKGSMVVLLGVRGGIVTDQYKAGFEKLAEETDVIFVPNVLDNLFGNSEYMADSVHPNDAGYAVITDRIFEEIHTYLK
jgi:acyl-CoA thioesterase I